jgi:phospholipase/carboxylesterase
VSLGHSGDDPHADQPVRQAGVPPEEADAAVVMVHGRGATAESILAMSGEMDVEGVAYVAPQAAARTWYPNSFLQPVETNEPGRSSGLRKIAGVLEDLAAAGVPAERTVLMGFSQGACLTTEYAARNPRRYGGVAALSGGLIGPEIDEDAFDGSVEGTSVFLGCSDVDPHIPVDRVHETRRVFERLGAAVTEEIYEGMGHTVNEAELEHVRALVAGALS